MLVYFLQFYILLTVWMSAQCEGCDTGWFGSNCTMKCHCLSSQTCDDDGECPNNGQCEKGFFGPGCQYVDVLQLTNSPGPDQFLRDGNDSTCNPQTDADVVTVFLTEPVPFTWFRVAQKNKKNILNFKTTLNGVEGCTNGKKYPVSDTLVDVICERNKMITSLTISGPAAGSICSIYISGGRNVALKQAAKQPSNYQVDQLGKTRAENAVDGDTNQDYDQWHCTHTDSTQPQHWWTVTFSLPQLLYKVVIYNRDGGYEFRLRKFYIETFNNDNTRIDVYNKSYDTARLKYEINIFTKISIASFTLTKIQTDLSDPRSSMALVLCEVEAFGDPVCPVKTYGFYCEKECRCDATDICNPFSGVCVRGCQPGFYGLNCSSRCGEHCSSDGCEYQSGSCLQCTPGYLGAQCEQECNPGNFGPDCQLHCSEHCLDICNRTNGHCRCKKNFTGVQCTDVIIIHTTQVPTTFQRLAVAVDQMENDSECKSGRYGKHCALNCSIGCASECNRTNGNCRCKEKFSGAQCTGCVEKYFGIACDLQCALNCHNETCDQVSGLCVHCAEGYEGDYCLGVEPNYYLYLTPLFPIYILCCACYMGCSERKHDNNEEEEEEEGGDE